MVKRCAYGLCRSDDRYKERVEGVTFHPFPKPKTNLEKCLKWIKLCNRPHSQLNIGRVTKNTYVCSKHFHGNKGPTEEYPDPVPHNCSYTPQPPRCLPRKRPRLDNSVAKSTESQSATEQQTVVYDAVQPCLSSAVSTAETQTQNNWVDPMDILQLSCDMKRKEDENQQLTEKLQFMYQSYEAIYSKTIHVHAIKQNNSTQTNFGTGFNVNRVMSNPTEFKYYTGFTVSQFNNIYKFLVPSPDTNPVQIPSNRKNEVMELSLMDQLFLTIIKLRHDFHYTDLGYRYGITKQTVSIIFTRWINYMFLRFGEVSIWPPRDIIYEHMPTKYRNEFPNTFALLDCTEIKITKPSSLKAQSQTYSEYKSGNTLKGLVACDPLGSVLFASMLFSGSISDKDIFIQSGFKEMLLDLIEEGYLKQGDGLMADKGFNIENEVRACGLELNIPPFARKGQQMSQSDALLTKKVACHRVHVERAIERIKRFKIISGKVPLSLYTLVNQIWYVCAFLTNFFPPCIQTNTSEKAPTDE